MLNYTGHGSAKSLSEEAVITQNDIIQSTYKHLPIWITASCDFCPFDQVATSAGEDVFLNKVSGGIALFTTTRVAFLQIIRISMKIWLRNCLDRIMRERR